MEQNTINSAQKKTPVARVNGVIISEYQVAAALQILLDPYKDVMGKVRLPQQEMYAARKHAIDNLVMRELLYQEGCRRGIVATDEEIATVTAGSAAEYGSEQQFKAILVMMGLTPAEFRDQVQKDIIINKTAASVVEGKRKPVTPQEARRYYDEHPDEMQGPEVRKVLHVMQRLDRYADPAEEKKVRQELEKLASDPAAFEKVIAEGSLKGTEIKGANLGFIARGQFHPLLDSVAFRMRQGEISRVIRSEEGLHIIMVKTILEGGNKRPFELIEEDLKAKLYEIRSVALLNTFTDGLREKADVTILDSMADSKLQQEAT
jgi:peptidyl-prolyl cis-trans isomerase C